MLSTTSVNTMLAGRYRDLWAAHAAHVHGVIFVVDVTDRGRIAVAREELHAILASRGNRMMVPLLTYQC